MFIGSLPPGSRSVALLAEGVDRNDFEVNGHLIQHTVALLAEGVDRNTRASSIKMGSVPSPSSRRAWIEIRWEVPP